MYGPPDEKAPFAKSQNLQQTEFLVYLKIKNTVKPYNQKFNSIGAANRT